MSWLRTRPQTLLLPLISICLSCLLIEVALRIVTPNNGNVELLLGRRWYPVLPIPSPEHIPEPAPQANDYRVYDPDLGWTLGPMGRDEPLYYSDPSGVRVSRVAWEAIRNESRAEREIEADIVALGDSFTHGDEVAFEESWPAQLGAISGLDVANLGVGGYGIDQALLRYVKLRPKSQLVILGLIPGDLERAMTQVYSLQVGGTKSKPILIEGTGGDLIVANRPALAGEALRLEFQLGVESAFFERELLPWRHLFERRALDALYLFRVPRSVLTARRIQLPPVYRTPGPLLDHALSILDWGRQQVESQGASFLVLLLENNNTFTDREHLGSDPWHILRARLEDGGFEVISATQAVSELAREGRDRAINPGGVHYTPEANRRVAQVVQESIPVIATSVRTGTLEWPPGAGTDFGLDLPWTPVEIGAGRTVQRSSRVDARVRDHGTEPLANAVTVAGGSRGGTQHQKRDPTPRQCSSSCRVEEHSEEVGSLAATSAVEGSVELSHLVGHQRKVPVVAFEMSRRR